MIYLIPFRKGSSRVPDKNIRDFNGMPLFLHTYNEALKVLQPTDTLILATDYTKGLVESLIKDFSLRYPLNVHIYKRDYVDNNQLYVEYLREVMIVYNLNSTKDICLLQPTCPLRDALDIKNAVEIFNQSNNPVLLSVEDIGPANKIYKELEGNNLSCITQSLDYSLFTYDKKLYRRNSAIYIFSIKFFKFKGTIYHENPEFYEMPRYKCIDINTDSDFRMAELVQREVLE